MKLLRIAFWISCLTSLQLNTSQLKAQDTTRYCQENGVLFSNCYEFVRTDKTKKFGTFTQRTATNDGQVFYGWGSFVETKTTFLLTYSKINTYPEVKTANARSYSDTLCIQWFSRDNVQEFFTVKYQDSTHTQTYKSDWEKAMVKIAKEELKDTKLELYQGSKKILDFTVNSSRTDFIMIYAEDPHTLYIHKDKETLTKTNSGFTTKGVRTKEKKSNFYEIK